LVLSRLGQPEAADVLASTTLARSSATGSTSKAPLKLEQVPQWGSAGRCPRHRPSDSESSSKEKKDQGTAKQSHSSGTDGSTEMESYRATGPGRPGRRRRAGPRAGRAGPGRAGPGRAGPGRETGPDLTWQWTLALADWQSSCAPRSRASLTLNQGKRVFLLS
jgi:hypothetical protein